MDVYDLSKSIVYDLSNCAIFNNLERCRPLPGFKVIPFFGTKYLRNDTRYIVSMEY